MKNFGFTLMEVIVALGVVGVVAAISTPLLSDMIPDKDKVAVLKAYSAICQANTAIKDDPAVWSLYQSEDLRWKHLVNNPKSYAKPFTDYVHISQTPSDAEFASHQVRFDTVDGISWFINDNDNDAAYITINLHREGKTAGVFSANNQKPRDFSFVVNAETLQASPNDALTAAYLANPNKLNDKKQDFRTARNDNTGYTRTYDGNF